MTWNGANDPQEFVEDYDEPEVCTGCGEAFTDMDAIEEVGIRELRSLLFHSKCLVQARRAHGEPDWPLIDVVTGHE